MNQHTSYCHTQSSPLSILLIAVAIGSGGIAWALSGIPLAVALFSLVAMLIAVTAGCFHQLTVAGRESDLLIQFGPIPLFRKSIPYSSMASVKASRSRFIDGWGVHYLPLRGWTYNLWGFGCVLIRRHNKSPVRIGTNDVEGLMEFLESKVGQQ